MLSGRQVPRVAATVVLVLVALATSAFGQPSDTTAQVKSLIVQYVPGRVPTDTVPLLGSSKVTGKERQMLRLGPALGNDMWRVDFSTAVSRTVALRVARQLADHRFILIAEIDEPVKAFAR